MFNYEIKCFMNFKLIRWQSTGNRKTWARIPAQSKASFFHRKIFKFFKYLFHEFTPMNEINYN